MVSTTTFGDFPGVRVDTAGGAITGIAVGREQRLVVVGVGDPSAGSASTNTAVSIDSRTDPATQFGDGSELTEALLDTLDNGANIDFLYGVMTDETSVTDESASSTSFTLANAPIIEDESSTGSGNAGNGSLIVTDTSASIDLTVEFRYDSPPTAPSDTDTAHINPITGEVEINSSNSNFEVDYDYPDWSGAFDAAEGVVDENEFGIITALTESESIATNLSGRLNTLRQNFQMVMGLSGAEPNDNQSEDNDADYDTGSFTTSLDNDAYYLHAPARLDESQNLVSGALSGAMAGNRLDESIFNQNLTSDDLDVRLTSTEAQDLRDANVIPIRQPSNGGTITVRGNSSTSTSTDYLRTYFVQRIVDVVTVTAREVGRSILGNINDDETRETVQRQLEVELRGLARDRLIEPGQDDSWFVDVYEIDANRVGVDLGITPQGIAKEVQVNLTINT